MAKQSSKSTKKSSSGRASSGSRSASTGTASASSIKLSPSEKQRSKSEVFGQIAEQTGLSRKQVSQVFDVMRSMIEKDLSKRGCGVFAVPGMMKLKAVHKPAEKATTRANPFKPGEMMTVKAKPARTVIKVRPLKALKDSI
jgi:nucleoid DNA-binding protein